MYMYTYMYMYMCVCACACVCIYIRIYVYFIYVDIYIYICMYIYIRACSRAHTHICNIQVIWIDRYPTRRTEESLVWLLMLTVLSIRSHDCLHTSAYVSIRQHMSATTACPLQHTSAYVSIALAVDVDGVEHPQPRLPAHIHSSCTSTRNTRK